MLRFLDFDFDPRIEWSSTLPSELYFKAEVLDAERRRIFFRSWQLVGRLDQVNSPGTYFTSDVAGEPLLVVRDIPELPRVPVMFAAIGRVKWQSARANVGSFSVHIMAGHMVLTARFLECRTGKAFRGLLRSRWGSSRSRLLSGISLFSHAWRTVQRLSMSSLDDITRVWPAQKYQRCSSWRGVTMLSNAIGRFMSTTISKVITSRLSIPRSCANSTSNTTGLLRAAIRHFRTRRSGLREDWQRRYNPSESQREALFFWMFPNLMLNVYPDNMSTNLIIPLGPERTLTVFEWYFAIRCKNWMRLSN